MMRCENCSHECTVVDFVALRNLCEHLYLDSLAKQGNSILVSGSNPAYSGATSKNLEKSFIESAPSRG